MYDQVPELCVHALDETATFFTGRVPAGLLLNPAEQEGLWALCPEEPQRIVLHGRQVPIPRRNQAYGADYHFAGQTSRALPVPTLLEPLLAWVREAIESRTNGILVNWYDGELGHYIGAHRDSTKHMYQGAPIVTVSVGAARTFRLRRWKGRERYDFPAEDGTVFILPYETNLAWTHEVVHLRSDRGRRISVTLRAFVPTFESEDKTSEPEQRSPNHV